jgi:hypothetical protein
VSDYPLSSIDREPNDAEMAMLTVDYNRWDQEPETLRALGLNAQHPRTRERFLALYEICGDQNASQVGRETGRNPQTVMDWVHRYNEGGPTALVYQHTGGPRPISANLFCAQTDVG